MRIAVKAELEAGCPGGRAIAYIHEHLSEDVSLTAIAVEIGISPYYFCRLFKQAMGVSLHQYVIQQRVERSKALLKQKGTSIATIALECGFGDHSHFTRHFRQLTGTTPKAYRKGF